MLNLTELNGRLGPMILQIFCLLKAKYVTFGPLNSIDEQFFSRYFLGGLSTTGHQRISVQRVSTVQSSRHEFLALQKLRRGQLSKVFRAIT